MVLLSILVLLPVSGRMVFLSILVLLLVSGNTVSADVLLVFSCEVLRIFVQYGRMLSSIRIAWLESSFWPYSLSCTVTWLAVRLLPIFAFPFISTGASFPGPSGLGLCWFLCAFPACRN